jgi:hypothetical protein
MMHNDSFYQEPIFFFTTGIGENEFLMKGKHGTVETVLTCEQLGISKEQLFIWFSQFSC